MRNQSDIKSTIDARSGSFDANSLEKISSDGPLASLHREFRGFIADMDSIAQQSMLLNLNGEDLNGIRERLAARVKQAKASVEESTEIAAESLQRYAGNALRGTSHYVRERPWQAVAIGAAVGVALGLLVVYRKSLGIKF